MLHWISLKLSTNEINQTELRPGNFRPPRKQCNVWRLLKTRLVLLIFLTRTFLECGLINNLLSLVMTRNNLALMYLDLNRVALSPFVTWSLIIVFTLLGVSKKSLPWIVRMLARTQYRDSCAALVVLLIVSLLFCLPDLPASPSFRNNWRLRSEVRFWWFVMLGKLVRNIHFKYWQGSLLCFVPTVTTATRAGQCVFSLYIWVAKLNYFTRKYRSPSSAISNPIFISKIEKSVLDISFYFTSTNLLVWTNRELFIFGSYQHY